MAVNPLGIWGVLPTGRNLSREQRRSLPGGARALMGVNRGVQTGLGAAADPRTLSVLADATPGVGTAKGLSEVLYGKDPITEAKVNRAMAAGGVALGFIPGGRLALKGAIAGGRKLFGKGPSAAEIDAARKVVEEAKAKPQYSGTTLAVPEGTTRLVSAADLAAEGIKYRGVGVGVNQTNMSERSVQTWASPHKQSAAAAAVRGAWSNALGDAVGSVGDVVRGRRPRGFGPGSVPQVYEVRPEGAMEMGRYSNIPGMRVTSTARSMTGKPIARGWGETLRMQYGGGGMRQSVKEQEALGKALDVIAKPDGKKSSRAIKKYLAGTSVVQGKLRSKMPQEQVRLRDGSTVTVDQGHISPLGVLQGKRALQASAGLMGSYLANSAYKDAQGQIDMLEQSRASDERARRRARTATNANPVTASSPNNALSSTTKRKEVKVRADQQQKRQKAAEDARRRRQQQATARRARQNTMKKVSKYGG